MHAPVSTSTSHSPRNTSIVTGLAALAAFVLLALAARTHMVDGIDEPIQRWCATHQSTALRDFFDVVSNVAGITGMRVLGFASALLLFFRSRRLGVVMVVVVLAGMEAFEIAKRFIARPRPVHGSATDPTFAFPSGHATLSAAVCGALAYVLWRERLVPKAAAIGVGIALPLLVGITRVYLDMHWTTDVIGGWLAGLTIACAAAAVYESTTTRT